MNRILPLIVVSLVVLVSCTPDEPTINSFNDEWRLVVTESGGVSTVVMPSGNTGVSNVWSGPSGVSFPVTFIATFRSELYLLHATMPWIIVLESQNLVALDTIDLGTSGIAADIAFANATTAYVSLPKSTSIGIVDLTVNQLVRTIDAGGTSSGIAAIGNQVCAALTDKNEVVVIDTRTNVIEARRPVGTAPVYVEADGLNQVFCIVSLGAGKLDAELHTPPTISFMTAKNSTIVKTLEISGRPTNAALQYPRGLVVNASEYAFIPVQNGLVTVNTRTRTKASVVQFQSYDAITYNLARAEIVAQRRSDGNSVIEVMDEFGESVRTSISRADSTTSLCGIGR